MAEIDPQEVETVIVAVPEPEIVVVSEDPAIALRRPRKVYGGMWGPPEIGAAAVAALVVLLVAVVYIFWVIPSDRELARNKSEADRLAAELASATTKYGDIASTETQVAKIVASIDDFEAGYLPLPSNGLPAIYQRLNGLISAYGLVNTTGPTYAPLETADLNASVQTEEEKGRAKYRSLYPGVYISATVEGSYHNLRRFIREIETGREFIVVSAVELAPSDTEKKKEQPADPNSNPAQAQNPVRANPPLGGPAGKGYLQPNQFMVQGQEQIRRPEGKMHGETVTLHIEMAAYFRRPRTEQPVQE